MIHGINTEKHSHTLFYFPPHMKKKTKPRKQNNYTSIS